MMRFIYFLDLEILFTPLKTISQSQKHVVNIVKAYRQIWNKMIEYILINLSIKECKESPFNYIQFVPFFSFYTTFYIIKTSFNSLRVSIKKETEKRNESAVTAKFLNYESLNLGYEVRN